jgi:hypothetical protein
MKCDYGIVNNVHSLIYLRLSMHIFPTGDKNLSPPQELSFVITISAIPTKDPRKTKGKDRKLYKYIVTYK